MDGPTKKLREQQEWSQKDLAEKAGVSREYLARLETGKQDPRVSVLQKIARALGVKISALVDSTK